jgi:hypothetical protein
MHMAVYNAESALVRLPATHHPRARHEARTLLREIFARAAELHSARGRLHVRVNALSAPRRTRAMAGLCAELTAPQARYQAPPHPRLRR